MNRAAAFLGGAGLLVGVPILAFEMFGLALGQPPQGRSAFFIPMSFLFCFIGLATLLRRRGLQIVALSVSLVMFVISAVGFVVCSCEGGTCSGYLLPVFYAIVCLAFVRTRPAPDAATGEQEVSEDHNISKNL